jgi:hypothetical protein
MNPAGNPFLSFMGSRPVRKESWTCWTLTVEKGRMEILEKVLWKRVMEEDLEGVRLFNTMFTRRVIPLAVGTIKMWEYTGPADHDQVSPKVVSNDLVWSWLDMVLKVGNQRIVGGPKAFDKRHPPNLVSCSSLLLPIGHRASNRALTLPHFLGAWLSPVSPPPPEGAEGTAKQATQVDAFRARKNKKAEKVKKRLKREIEIARRVRMGEDRDAVQEDLQSESSTDSDREEESEEMESDYEDDSVFVVAPHGTAATGTSEGSGSSSSAPKVRKHATDKDAVQVEAAKRARVERHSEGLLGSPAPVVNAEWREDKTGARTRSASRLEAVGAAALSNSLKGASQGSSTVGTG